MKEIAIVYMVAGISSRFGGKIKQLIKITDEETLIEYSLKQSIKAGITKIIFILVIALPILMISRFTYFTLPKLSKKSIKKNFPILLILISVLIIIGLTKGEAAFPFVILYILSGIIMSIAKMFTKRKPPRS